MSAEHRLTDMAAAVCGKHPAFGDFIMAGAPEDVLRPLLDWSGAALGRWREQAGPDWQAIFDAAPPVRFWIGPALMRGRTPLRGVWAPSRDKSGRRFPLMLLRPGGPAPALVPAQEFYDAAAAALQELLANPAPDPRAEATRLASELPGDGAGKDGQPDYPTFWVTNNVLDPQALLADLGRVDHAYATSARSYWWFAHRNGHPAGAVACDGWPDPGILDWMLHGGHPPAPTQAQLSSDEGASA